MKLLGTTTSPYTRKVRILMNALGRPYDFLDTRSTAGAALLLEAAPLGKIPVLLTETGTIENSGRTDGSPGVLADSSLIAQWLWATAEANLRAAGWDLNPAAWENRSLQIVVEGALDAAINYRYLRQDGFADAGYIAKQRQRVERTLTWLDGRCLFRRPLGAAELSLGCALDWIVFRNAVELPRWKGLSAFRDAWSAAGVGAGTEPHE